MGILNLTCRNRFKKAAGRTYPDLVQGLILRHHGVSAPKGAGQQTAPNAGDWCRTGRSESKNARRKDRSRLPGRAAKSERIGAKGKRCMLSGMIPICITC